MICLAQLLCSKRHAVYVIPYNNLFMSHSAAEGAVVAGSDLRRCKVCGSTGPFTVEHCDTGFKTVVEASVHALLVNRASAKRSTP